jgi:hypothetical protein
LVQQRAIIDVGRVDPAYAVEGAADMKKIVDLKTAMRLRELVRVGKARVVKEHTDAGLEIFVWAPGGSLMAVIGKRYRYMFEAALLEQGSGDGLLEGHHQTTVPVS